MGERYGQGIKNLKVVGHGRDPRGLARTIGGLGPRGCFEGEGLSVRLSQRDREEWASQCLRGASDGVFWSGSVRVVQREEMDDLRDLWLVD